MIYNKPKEEYIFLSVKIKFEQYEIYSIIMKC